jgi:3-phosphoshikimate 1-carboxyvinyltransferase
MQADTQLFKYKNIRYKRSVSLNGEGKNVLVENRNRLRGEISVPGDKSISHRAIVIGALASGTTEIENFLLGEDCISTIDCFRRMQVSTEILKDNRVRVQGKGLYGLKQPTSVLNAGRAGTSIRLLLGVLSGQPFTSTVIRDEGSMKKPIGNTVDFLRQMGASITAKDDGSMCPLMMSPSKLKGIECELPIHEMHIKSPLLLAGLYAEGETVVKEPVASRNHTELMLNYFGADIKTEGTVVRSHPVENLYAQKVIIPGDISIAAYFITAALIVPDSDIIIRNVGVNPTRSGILEIFKAMGGNIELLDERNITGENVADIQVRSSRLKAVKIDEKQIPGIIDELPVIITACALAEGTTEITGLSGFKVKKTGKIRAISLELSKMGARITETEDGLVIEGREALRGTVVDSNNNHSHAMALSVAGLAAQGETMIRKTQAVDIVYPAFYETLNRL